MPDRPDGPVRPSGPPLGGDRPIVYRKPRNWFQRHLSALIAIGVVVVVVGGIVAAVLAVRNVGDVAAAEPSDVFSSAAPASSTAASATPSATTTGNDAKLTGAVTAVVAPGQWTVEVPPGLDIPVVTTPATTYAQGRTVDDVKKGTNITVVGTMADGVVTATSVTIEKKSSGQSPT